LYFLRPKRQPKLSERAASVSFPQDLFPESLEQDLNDLVAAPRRLEIFKLARNELLFASAFT
jgi:hypothetical protein